MPDFVSSQKAPSAKRCIKTQAIIFVQRCSPVRKHRAPKGALRCAFMALVFALSCFLVRKHRAPNGALRPTLTPAVPILSVLRPESTEHQKVH